MLDFCENLDFHFFLASAVFQLLAIKLLRRLTFNHLLWRVLLNFSVKSESFYRVVQYWELVPVVLGIWRTPVCSSCRSRRRVAPGGGMRNPTQCRPRMSGRQGSPVGRSTGLPCAGCGPPLPLSAPCLGWKRVATFCNYLDLKKYFVNNNKFPLYLKC